MVKKLIVILLCVFLGGAIGACIKRGEGQERNKTADSNQACPICQKEELSDSSVSLLCTADLNMIEISPKEESENNPGAGEQDQLIRKHICPFSYLQVSLQFIEKEFRIKVRAFKSADHTDKGENASVCDHCLKKINEAGKKEQNKAILILTERGENSFYPADRLKQKEIEFQGYKVKLI